LVLVGGCVQHDALLLSFHYRELISGALLYRN